MQDPKDASGGNRHIVSENQTEDDIKHVIINLHPTPSSAANVTVNSTSIPSKPSPVLLTAVSTNKRTLSPQTLLIPSTCNNNPPSALPPAILFGGEPKIKKRKTCEQEVLAGTVHNVANANTSMVDERKSEAYYFGQFVVEALKTMSPDARYWCQMEISKIIYQARSAGSKSSTSTNNATSH